MKKYVALVLALVLSICTMPAYAAGKLNVAQENFHVIDSYSIYGYAYAKVENTGDKPIKVNAGLLEIFDTEGDTLTSNDYMNAHAEYLQAGEYTYIVINENINVETPDEVDDYMLTITGKSDTDQRSMRLPVETSYDPNVQEGYWTYNYMTATVTNDTEETVFGLTIVLVLLDDEGNILYMDNDYMYDKGLTPGSSVVVHKDVNSSFMDYFKAKGYTPTTVDAIAYVNVAAEADE